MRIKLFESMDEYFSDITESEYNYLVGDSKKHLDFTNSEINKIKTLKLEFIGKISNSRIFLNSKLSGIIISKVEDEYFTILFKKRKHQEQIIKCDQFDGLIKYLSENYQS